MWDGSKTSKVTSKALLVRILALDSFFEEVSCVFSRNMCIQKETRGPGGILPYRLYMGYIRVCRCEGYGFKQVSIGYINQSVWV